MVYSFLKKLKVQYLEKKEGIDKSIARFQIYFKENIELINSLENNVNESYESFSPRNMKFKDEVQIKELEAKQKEILEEINQLKGEQITMIQQIDEIDNVIKIAELYKSNEKVDMDEFGLTLLETQENERQRISRELHDSTVQNLTAMVHKTELCSKLIEVDPVRCKLELTMMSKTLRDIINDTRQMIYDLRPMSFDDIGLDITIERALDKIKNDNSCNINFEVEGESYSIKPVIGITILRIIQEACNNAIKYAESTIISVRLIYTEDMIEIFVEDDGNGFDIENLDVADRNDNSGFGLSIMKERVYLLSGEISITSEKNVGTSIKVKVPINSKEEKY